ncbi:MAG: hypothetical protein SFV52_13755 [Saprospiraceae bacterium]|nr:hypothetical protein [Saprospiraceae bacterium]
MTAQRFHPARCRDVCRLSITLDRILSRLEGEPIGLTCRALGYDTGIPESVWTRLREAHRRPDMAEGVTEKDFHIAFANLLFRYPTIKLWTTSEGAVFLEF